MHRLVIALLIVVSVALTSCITVSHTQLETMREGTADIYVTTKPDRNYTELEYMEASASVFHTHRKLLHKLRVGAKERGADALVNVRFFYAGLIPVVSGVAVKYTPSGN